MIAELVNSYRHGAWIWYREFFPISAKLAGHKDEPESEEPNQMGKVEGIAIPFLGFSFSDCDRIGFVVR
jgi:hypothetical protein